MNNADRHLFAVCAFRKNIGVSPIAYDHDNVYNLKYNGEGAWSLK